MVRTTPPAERVQWMRTLSLRTRERSTSIGFRIHGFFMIGFGNETESDILRLGERLPSLPIHQLRLSIATPFPGTPWYEQLRRKGRMPANPDWGQYDTTRLVYAHPSITPERMKGLQDELYRRFYLSSAWDRRISDHCSRVPADRNGFGRFRDHITFLIRKL